MLVNFPVVVCGEHALTCANLCIRFVHHHVQYTIVIMEEVNCLQPRCPACDMSVPWAEMNNRCPTTMICAWWGNRKRQWISEEESQAGVATAFQAYGRPLENHLGRLLAATDYDFPEVIINLYKAQNRCSCLSIILGREGADPRTTGHFYIAVVQEVLLFGVETWVVTP